MPRGVLARGAFVDRIMKVPIKEEIHKYHAEHARKFKFDLTAICEDLREQSRKLNVVRLPPNSIVPKKINSVRP